MAMMNPKRVMIIEDYNPKIDNTYMSPSMLAYFKAKLQNWKNSIIYSENRIKNNFENLNIRETDQIDEGIVQELRIEESSLLEHDINLLKQIDEALERIEKGEYGYCEKTGEEIGFARLDAWPIARFSIQAQEELEKRHAENHL